MVRVLTYVEGLVLCFFTQIWSWHKIDQLQQRQNRQFHRTVVMIIELSKSSWLFSRFLLQNPNSRISRMSSISYFNLFKVSRLIQIVFNWMLYSKLQYFGFIHFAVTSEYFRSRWILALLSMFFFGESLRKMQFILWICNLNIKTSFFVSFESFRRFQIFEIFRVFAVRIFENFRVQNVLNWIFRLFWLPRKFSEFRRFQLFQNFKACVSFWRFRKMIPRFRRFGFLENFSGFGVVFDTHNSIFTWIFCVFRIEASALRRTSGAVGITTLTLWWELDRSWLHVNSA